MKNTPSATRSPVPALATFLVLLGLVSLGNSWAAWLPLALMGLGAGLGALWVATVLLGWLWPR